MSLVEIKNQLEQQHIIQVDNASTLVLDATSLHFTDVNAQHIAQVLQLVLPQNQLHITLDDSGALSIQEEKLTFAGSAQWWGLAVHASGYFVLNNNQLDLVINMHYQGNWRFVDSFPSLTNVGKPTSKALPNAPSVTAISSDFLQDVTYQNPLFIISSYSFTGEGISQPLNLGLNLVADTELNGALGVIAHWIGHNQPVQTQGTVSFSQDNSTTSLPDLVSPNSIDLDAHIAGQFTLGPLTFDHFAINTSLITYSLDGNESSKDIASVVSIDAGVQIGSKTVDVSAVLPVDENQPMQFKSVFNGALPSLADLISFAGDSIGLAVPEPIKQATSFSISSVNVGYVPSSSHLAFVAADFVNPTTWSLLPDIIEVSDIEIKCMVIDPLQKQGHSQLSATLSGEIDIEGAIFQVAVKMPEESVSGWLKPGNTIYLGAFLTKFVPGAPEMSSLSLNQASVAYDHSEQNFSLLLGSDDTWSLPFFGQQKIDVTSVILHINRTGNEQSSQFTAGLQGEILLFDVPIQLSAQFSAQDHKNQQQEGAENSTSESGWDFSGTAGSEAQPVKLTRIVDEISEVFGGHLSSQAPDVDITKISIAFNTATKDVAFSGATHTQIEIPFLTGDHAKIHASVELQSQLSSSTGKRELSGFMEGDFTIGSSKFTLQYQLGQDSHIFEASWESTSDSDLLGIDTFLDAMGVSNDISIPHDVDLNLKKVYLRYQAERETLQLVADSATYGDVFLIVSKLPIGQPHPDEDVPEPGQGTWQFVFGWDYANTHTFSQVPVLGHGFGPADIFHLDSVGIIISSADIKQFEIPELPALTTLTSGVNTALNNATNTVAVNQPRKPVGQGNVIPLTKGIAFVAVMDLGKSEQSGSMAPLRTIVTETTLTVMAEVDIAKEAFSISAILQGSVDIPTGASSDLRIGNAGLSFIFNDGIIFQLFGDLSMHLGDQTVDVEPKLSISEEEIEFSVPITFENGWHSPMGIQGLTLDEIAFAMGINLLPAPGVNLGLQGQSHIGDQPRASDNFAFVLEIVEEVPDPLLLSFYLEEVDIKTAFEVFVPDEANTLPPIVNEINLTDVNFYWAESVVIMPDGTVAQPGLRVSGNLELLGFSAHAALAIDQTSGIAGEFETSPVHFHNVLSVTGKGKGVYLNQKNGKTLPVTIEPNKDNTGVSRVEVVPPGGPVFIFRTLSSPYLQMSIKVSFLDLVSEEIEALVANDGIYFKFEYDLAHLVKAEFDFTLSESGFIAHSDFGLHLKADLGPIKILGVDFGSIHLDTGFDIRVYIRVDADQFKFCINGDFEFEGARLSFPEISLSFAPKSLSELPEIIIKQIEDHLEEIFRDLFDSAAQLLKEGFKEVEHLAEEAGKEVAKIATEAEQEAKKLVSDAAAAVEHSAEEAAQAVVAIEHEAEKVLTDAAQEVAHIGQEAAQEVEKIGQDIAHVAQAAEHEVEAIGQEIVQEAQEVAHEVEHLASEAVAEVEAIGKAAEEEAKTIVNAAHQAADAVINAAKKVVDVLNNEAKALWSEAKKLADDLANAAKKVGHAVEGAAKSVWHAVSKY